MEWAYPSNLLTIKEQAFKLCNVYFHYACFVCRIRLRSDKKFVLGEEKSDELVCVKNDM